jgi:hypothetical protein
MIIRKRDDEHRPRLMGFLDVYAAINFPRAKPNSFTTYYLLCFPARSFGLLFFSMRPPLCSDPFPLQAPSPALLPL